MEKSQTKYFTHLNKKARRVYLCLKFQPLVLTSHLIQSKMLRKLTGRKRHLGSEKYRMDFAGFVIAWTKVARPTNNLLSLTEATEWSISEMNWTKLYVHAAKKETRKGPTEKIIRWSSVIVALLIVNGLWKEYLSRIKIRKYIQKEELTIISFTLLKKPITGVFGILSTYASSSFRRIHGKTYQVRDKTKLSMMMILKS